MIYEMHFVGVQGKEAIGKEAIGNTEYWFDNSSIWK